MARRRISKNIPLRPLIVIFSDGETELNYFSCKKIDLTGNRNLKIEPVFINKKTATGIVLFAKKHIQNKYDNKPNDRYFCVLDMDCMTDMDIAKALKEKPEKMELIVSNPDFEFWFLLHYTYHEGSLQKREPIEKLREYERGYKKPDIIQIYPSLKSKEKDAISHAKRLREFHKSE